MYLNCRVKMPDMTGITIKTIKGTPYVYYEYGRTYLKDRKYNIPNRKCIGKRDPEQPDFIYPNDMRVKSPSQNWLQALENFI